MASRRNGTLYVGVTGNLLRRVGQHKNNTGEGFTKRYQVHLLVYFEETSEPAAAIAKERQIKKWNRAWKLRLIEECNPKWKDLYYYFIDSNDSGFPPARE